MVDQRSPDLRPDADPWSPARQDPDLDRLAELAACLAGDEASNLLARTRPGAGEDYPELRDRLVRAALRTETYPVIVGDVDPGPPIVTWLRRLPVADRVLLTLRFRERLAPAELARILDQSRASITARLDALLADVPEPVEGYVSYALDRLAATAPDPATIRRAGTARAGRIARRRRGTAGLVGVALVFVIIAALTSTLLTPARPQLGGWHLGHRVDPPTGWTVGQIAVSRWDESTWLRRGTEECRVTIQGSSDFGGSPVRGEGPASDRAVQVGTETGWLSQDSNLYWDHGDLLASVTCGPPGDAGRLFAIAESIRFESRPLRIPVGLPEPPLGVQEPMISLMPDGSTWITARRILFAVAFTVPLRSASGAACPRSGPTFRSVPDADAEQPELPVDRWYGGPPTGSICVELTWLGEPDPARRTLVNQQVAELMQHLVVAPDPDDPATWFDANAALPPRQPR
ncbi:hypothetical protein [Microlunatus speluncae]|uniref:hypothetical protein n=1 Tax=Microlunatus speluncae TaxID=2594267 RepID=UPI00126644A2|nr:hypothetical protein [Microlunatus speluncae]